MRYIAKTPKYTDLSLFKQSKVKIVKKISKEGHIFEK